MTCAGLLRSSSQDDAESSSSSSGYVTVDKAAVISRRQGTSPGGGGGGGGSNRGSFYASGTQSAYGSRDASPDWDPNTSQPRRVAAYPAAPPSMIISTRRATSVEERGAWPPPGARLDGRDASLETTDQTGNVDLIGQRTSFFLSVLISYCIS